MESLDGPLPKWCPAVALSHQDGRHSAVALLLKSAFEFHYYRSVQIAVILLNMKILEII
jgi:hypothetical protein